MALVVLESSTFEHLAFVVVDSLVDFFGSHTCFTGFGFGVEVALFFAISGWEIGFGWVVGA